MLTARLDAAAHACPLDPQRAVVATPERSEMPWFDAELLYDALTVHRRHLHSICRRLQAGKQRRPTQLTPRSYLASQSMSQRFIPAMLRNALPKKPRQSRPQQLAQRHRSRHRNPNLAKQNKNLQAPKSRKAGVLEKWDASVKRQVAVMIQAQQQASNNVPPKQLTYAAPLQQQLAAKPEQTVTE